jgi:hypothetical protein
VSTLRSQYLGRHLERYTANDIRLNAMGFQITDKTAVFEDKIWIYRVGKIGMFLKYFLIESFCKRFPAGRDCSSAFWTAEVHMHVSFILEILEIPFQFG